ncbi:MAG TPA: ABC transporter permease [Candidatus Methylomirabilis sp.]|nr:ABC transporter permease [Candidatus Methylomirabilis sp.]
MASGLNKLQSVLQDMRFALRALRKSPGFTATAILTLALGTGANTAIFQLLDVVRLRPLPVPHPEEIASIEVRGGLQGFGVRDSDTLLTYPLWAQIREHQEGFAGVFGWGNTVLSYGQGAHERLVSMLWVTGELFPTLGVKPYRGRLFTPEDNKPGCGTPGVVISYAVWQSDFGGREDAIGSKVLIVDHPVELIGVTPPNFYGMEVGKNFELAMPFCSRTTIYPDDFRLTRRDYFWVAVGGRLKAGWTLERASAQLESISPGVLEATAPEEYAAPALATYRRFKLMATPGETGVSPLRQEYDTSLWLLLGITGLVLLIACANLGNLMLVRASAREREMAVRLALGASRARVAQQLFLESLEVALGGSFVGVCLAPVLGRTVVKFLSTERDPLQLHLNLDWRVLTFALLVTAATCVLFGVVPAFRAARTEPCEVLKLGGRGMTTGRKKFSFQQTLVVSQIAFSMVLLAGALLFVRSFWNLATLDPGFAERGILITFVNFLDLKLPRERYELFKHELLEQIRAIPLVDSAATSTQVPLANGNWSLEVRLGATERESKFTWVSPGYFQTLQIPLLAGRDFNEQDTEHSSPVAIVNETFVREFLGGGNALGLTFRTNAEPHYPETAYQIVGVAKDTKYADLREAVPPMTFVPASQFPDRWYWTVVFIRSAAPPSELVPTVREKLTRLYPAMREQYDVFQTDIREGLIRERMMAMLSGFFGALAALLATMGLYGVISYILAMRRNEIGIRMALGASRDQVITGIVRQTMGLLLLGVAIGLAMCVAATRGAQALLFGLGRNDPASLLGAALFLAAVALLATLWPAYQATRIEPMKALRYD